MTGDYTKIMAEQIRSAVPGYSGRVVVVPQLPVEYRLSRAGLETQHEIREFGGGELEEEFLSASLEFAIPGVVSIQDLCYTQADSDSSKASRDTQTLPPEQKKKPKQTAWPVHKTESHVSVYLNGKKSLYSTMAGDVLDEMSGAYEKFRKEFGPTSIAKAINKKIATKNHRPCSRKDVCKTHTYKSRIQPLMQNPPKKPYDWDEILDDMHGESLPDILNNIPFEDDDS